MVFCAIGVIVHLEHRLQVFIVSDLDLILACIHLDWRNGAIKLIHVHKLALSFHLVIKVGFLTLLTSVVAFDLALKVDNLILRLDQALWVDMGGKASTRCASLSNHNRVVAQTVHQVRVPETGNVHILTVLVLRRKHDFESLRVQ